MSGAVLSASHNIIRDTEAYIQFKKRKCPLFCIRVFLILIILLTITAAFVLAFIFKKSMPISGNSTYIDPFVDDLLPSGKTAVEMFVKLKLELRASLRI